MSRLLDRTKVGKYILLKQKRSDFFTKWKDSEKQAAGTAGSGPEAETSEEKRKESEDLRNREGYKIRCPKCGKSVDRDRVVKRKYICYECNGYFRVKVNNRIRMVADPHSFEPWFTDMPVSNPLDYEGYEEKLAGDREKTGLEEAVTVGQCKVFGEDMVLGICDSRFLISIMGHVVVEKITSYIERAI